MVMPEFLRGYVWNREQVRGLMDSLDRGRCGRNTHKKDAYPLGNLQHQRKADLAQPGTS